MTPAWRCRSLRWLVRHEFRAACSAGEKTYPSTLLGVRACETTGTFGIIAIIALRIMLVAVHSSVARVLGWFDDACLVVEHDFTHPLQRDLDSFAVLQHVIHFVEPRYRLRGHADPLRLMGSLSVDFTEIGDSTRTFSHLRRISVGIAKQKL